MEYTSCANGNDARGIRDGPMPQQRPQRILRRGHRDGHRMTDLSRIVAAAPPLWYMAFWCALGLLGALTYAAFWVWMLGWPKR